MTTAHISAIPYRQLNKNALYRYNTMAKVAKNDLKAAISVARAISNANLSKTGGPGRGHKSPKTKKKEMELLAYMAKMMVDGKGVKLLKRVERKAPEKALSLSLDRVYGKAPERIEHTGRVDLRTIEVCFDIGAPVEVTNPTILNTDDVIMLTDLTQPLDNIEIDDDI